MSSRALLASKGKRVRRCSSLQPMYPSRLAQMQRRRRPQRQPQPLPVERRHVTQLLADRGG
jgi:hypothetical protein